MVKFSVQRFSEGSIGIQYKEEPARHSLPRRHCRTLLAADMHLMELQFLCMVGARRT